MTHVQDFNPDLCWISEESKLSAVTPGQAFENRPVLSLALAYMYLIMRELDTVHVEPEVFKILAELFPGRVKAKSEGITPPSGATITQVDATLQDSKWKVGLLMMPMYVPNDSTLVYNLHRVDAQEEEYTSELILGALNFFNCAIRSTTSGSKRVIIKDPINFSTRLQSANYDRMFALWLVDRYLSTFPDQYPVPGNPLQSLGMAHLLLEMIEDTTREKKLESIKKEDQQLTQRSLDSLIVPAEVRTDLELVSGTTMVDSTKRDLFSVLLFLSKYRPGMTTKLYLTGFKNYGFLKRAAEIHSKKVTFSVYEKSNNTVPQVTGVRNEKVGLTVSFLTSINDPTVVCFSDLRSNKQVLSSFSGQVVTRAGTSKFLPRQTYCTLFTGGRESGAYSVYDALKRGEKRIENEAAVEIEKNVKYYSRFLESEFRDTKKHGYTLAGKSGSFSYDSAALELVSST